MRKDALISCLLFFAVAARCQTAPAAKNLYEFDKCSVPGWSSFENPTGEKGKAAMENRGAKGHPADDLNPGQTRVLLKLDGTGIINRIWVTINDRSPEMLRSLKLEIFWDQETKPAVSVPFGDFFGMGLGKTATFHNVFFASPEGKSFLCFIPMPFKSGARVQITNEGKNRLSHIFYDIDFQKLDHWNPDNMYFHAYWHRDTATRLGNDFELLPAVSGKGRFLGVNVGLHENPVYKGFWWGEGEVKMYLDGDHDFPSLAGTGSEDYIGTGWGQGEFYTDYSGCLLANKADQGWAFYRYHVPDPIYFKKDCRVTLQQIGGGSKADVRALQKKGAPMIPVSVDNDRRHVIPLYKKEGVTDLSDPSLPEGFVNFYRSDDLSATAYFYLDKPADHLPGLQSVFMRVYKSVPVAK
jgi:hypothetical protein